MLVLTEVYVWQKTNDSFFPHNSDGICMASTSLIIVSETVLAPNNFSAVLTGLTTEQTSVPACYEHNSTIQSLRTRSSELCLLMLVPLVYLRYLLHHIYLGRRESVANSLSSSHKNSEFAARTAAPRSYVPVKFSWHKCLWPGTQQTA